VDFQKIFLMQTPLTLNVSEVISTYVYKIGLKSAQYSYAGAIGLFSSLINIIVLLTVNYLSKRISGVGIF
jgi:putative aldouronate transport system permease protein